MKYLSIIFLLTSCLSFSQNRQNENWVFGKNQWTFTNNTNGYNAFPSNNSTGLTLFDGVISESSTASVSDPNTGQLLFYTDGITVFDRNGNVMLNGTELFGTWNSGSGNLLDRFYRTAGFCGGTMGEQTALIIPKPFDVGIYYVISTAKGSYFNYCTQGFNTEYFNLGIRVAEIDMSQNNGLGAVISKNNILNSQGAQGITLAEHTVDGSYWLITNASTNSNSAFTVYEVDSSGINSTPVISSNNQTSFSFIKASPDKTKLVTLGSSVSSGPAYYLHDFDASTGIVSSPFKLNTVEPNNLLKPHYNNTAKVKGSAEFSENSNILYFIASANLGNSGSPVDGAGICKYNISTGQLVGVNNSGSRYDIPIIPGAQSASNFVSNLQIGPNQKIYGILNTQVSVSSTTNINKTNFVYSNNVTYDYIVIDDPNNWQTNPSSLLRFIQPDEFAINGYTFPQLVPEFITEPPCDEVTNIRIEQGNLYSWDSSETTFDFQYMEDSRCCGDTANDPDNLMFQITTSNNFINLDNLPGLLQGRECFSVRVKPTDCGEWGDWCCISGVVGGNYVLSRNCFPSDPCENITFQELITQNLNNVTNTFDNVINIEANNTITSSNIEYVATQSVTLLPGFEALNGTVFTARIDDCNINNLKMDYSNKNVGKSAKNNQTITNNEIVVYPNPAINSLTISSSFDNMSSIVFFDLKGRQMLSEININSTAFTIDISSLSSGVYIIKTIDEKGVQYTQKVIKE
ncbi:hypothetical protein BBFL7_01578 [Flavobacteria bacterium BBFL7]|nr:hypothetical protein BBFL7_01578 [Flavobacteria bacterium BBFL7]